jgi:hypothetical protein
MTYIDAGSINGANQSSGFHRSAAYLGSFTDAEAVALATKGQYPNWWYASGGAGEKVIDTIGGGALSYGTATASAVNINNTSASDLYLNLYTSSGNNLLAGKQIRITIMGASVSGDVTFYLMNNQPVSGVADGVYSRTNLEANTSYGFFCKFPPNTSASFSYKVEVLGCVAEMDPNWNGLGPNYPDSSGAARDWVLGSGAVPATTRDIVGQRVNIRGSILHSAISSLAGTTLLTAIPAGWVPVEFQANVSEGFGTGITLSVGTSGTPAAVVSALDVSAIALLQADSLKKVPFSLTAATNVYLKKNNSTITGNLLVYILTIEKKY